MSALEVSGDERGVIRVFALTAAPDTMDQAAVARALGVDRVDMSGVEIFPMADLEGVGLMGYLTQGLGVAPETMDDGQLDGIGEAVLILHSAAFGGRSMTLAPRPPVQLAGIYREMDGAPGDLMPSDVPVSPMDAQRPKQDSAVASGRWLWLLGIGAVLGFVLAFVLVLVGGRV